MKGRESRRHIPWPGSVNVNSWAWPGSLAAGRSMRRFFQCMTTPSQNWFEAIGCIDRFPARRVLECGSCTLGSPKSDYRFWPRLRGPSCYRFFFFFVACLSRFRLAFRAAARSFGDRYLVGQSVNFAHTFWKSMDYAAMPRWFARFCTALSTATYKRSSLVCRFVRTSLSAGTGSQIAEVKGAYLCWYNFRWKMPMR